VIIREPGRRHRTSIHQLTPTGEIITHRRAPFESLILTEEARNQKASRRELLASIAGWFSAVMVGLIACAFVFGLVQARVVASDSMAGTFSRGDLLVSVSAQLRQPVEGDVVVFNYYNFERTKLIGLFSHRIVGGNASVGWQTKGDANDDPEAAPVLSQDIVGVAVGWVPLVGFVLQPQVLLALLALALIVNFFWSDLVDAWKARKR
jgi:signal peptidase I